MESIAGGAGAERAGIGVRDVIARRAVGDSILDVSNRIAQALGVVARCPQDVKRQALRALRADTGQLLELLDQPGQGIGE